jgi:hypothetical protein
VPARAGAVVQCVRVQGRPARRRWQAYGRYLTLVLAEAEEDAGAAQATFDAFEPADQRADRLRGRLDELLTAATDTLPVTDRGPSGPTGRVAEAGPAAGEGRRAAARVRPGASVERFFAVAFGVLTAIGGFVDIGDIVARTETGARFGMSLAWVVVMGVAAICLFAEMAGRVATVSGRAVFDLVPERLGARVALVTLVASFFSGGHDPAHDPDERGKLSTMAGPACPSRSSSGSGAALS